MRRRTVCTMGAFLCLCMFLSLSMQASSLADIDDGGAVGRSAGVTPPLRVSRKSLRQRGHHDAGARDDLACDKLASANPLPPAPAGSLRFFSIGDWGVRGLSVGSDAQMRVARGMSCAARRWPVRFVLTLGDNFYGSGVTSVDDAQFEHKFESVYSDASLNVPWFPALGDHDQCGDVDAQAAYSMRSERWTMPSAYYQELLSFDGGDMQLVVVDWVRLEGAFSETSGDRRFHDRLRANQAGREAADAHWAWLRRVLTLGDPTWRIVVGHRPLASVSARSARDDVEFPAEARTRAALKELMLSAGVDVWLNGHDHTAQVACAESGGGSATTFATAGIGGYDLHALRPREEWPAETKYADASFHGFAAHTVTAEEIVSYFLDETGEVRHEFVVRKGGGCAGSGRGRGGGG